MTGFMMWLMQASLRAGFIVIVVLLLRLLFHKLHIAKRYTCLLWLIPFACLILPWQIESPFSIWGIIPGYENLVWGQDYIEKESIGGDGNLEANADGSFGNNSETGAWGSDKGEISVEIATDSILIWGGSAGANTATENDIGVTISEQGQWEGMPNNGQIIQLHEATNERIVIVNLLQIAFVVWIIGIVGMLVYVAVSVVKLRKQMLCCIKAEENIYHGDDITTPFVFGLIRPRIYLPSDMDENSRQYVTEHERTHILRRDPLKKMVAFLITTMHWFNPLVWVAFFMLEKDIEMACDEETVQRIGTEKKQDYATVLLQLSTDKNAFSRLGVPLAFGEGNASSRIKNILKYKKTAGVVAVAAVVLVLVLAGIFLTKPDDGEEGAASADTVQTDAAQTDAVQTGTAQTDTVQTGTAQTGTVQTDAAQTDTEQTDTPPTGTDVYDSAAGEGIDSENGDSFGEAAGEENNNEEILSPGALELTMEMLMDICDEGSEALANHMNGFGMGDGIPYTNFEKHDVEYSLTWSYICPLPYEGSDYQLQIIYWKEDEAEQYGHMPNELDSIILNNMTTGDGQLLYSTDTRYTVNTDVRSFAEKEYDLSNYLTSDLLDGMQLGAYQVGMNDNWEGCLFEGDYEELPHGEGTPVAWYAPGGVGVCPWDESYTYGNLSAEFANGLLTKVYWTNNHSGRTSEFETLENCDMQALLCEYSFDIFTIPEADEYRQEHGLTEEELQTVSKYWYVFFAEPDREYTYVLFLNQAYFSKEDVIALAESMEFVE